MFTRWCNVFMSQAGSEGGGAGSNSEDKNINNDKDVNQDQQSEKSKNVVSYDSFDKVLAQKKELQKRLKEIEDAKLENERQRKLEKEEFKALYEEEKQKREKAENNFLSISKARIDDFKEAAFLSALPSKLIKPEYILHADFDKIVINEETGQLDELSLKKVVDTFVKNNHYLLQKANDKNLPNDAGGQAKGNAISYEQWLKLPVKEKQLRIKDVTN